MQFQVSNIEGLLKKPIAEMYITCYYVYVISYSNNVTYSFTDTFVETDIKGIYEVLISRGNLISNTTYQCTLRLKSQLGDTYNRSVSITVNETQYADIIFDDVDSLTNNQKYVKTTDYIKIKAAGTLHACNGTDLGSIPMKWNSSTTLGSCAKLGLPTLIIEPECLSIGSNYIFTAYSTASTSFTK